MAQGGTTAIKPTASLQMPNEQKWARDFDNNRQADAVAGTLPSQNPNPNPDTQKPNQNPPQEGLFNSIQNITDQVSIMAGQTVYTEALRRAWQGLFITSETIIGSILCLLYINFHFIMTYLVQNKYFCKFGVAFSLGLGSKDDALGKMDGGLSETLTEYAEIVVLFLVDGLILFVLLLIACIISFIVWAATNRTEFVLMMGLEAWEVFNPFR